MDVYAWVQCYHMWSGSVFVVDHRKKCVFYILDVRNMALDFLLTFHDFNQGLNPKTLVLLCQQVKFVHLSWNFIHYFKLFFFLALLVYVGLKVKEKKPFTSTLTSMTPLSRQIWSYSQQLPDLALHEKLEPDVQTQQMRYDVRCVHSELYTVSTQEVRSERRVGREHDAFRHSRDCG